VVGGRWGGGGGGGGTAVAQWLRCCATNRKVAGSIKSKWTEGSAEWKCVLTRLTVLRIVHMDMRNECCVAWCGFGM